MKRTEGTGCRLSLAGVCLVLILFGWWWATRPFAVETEHYTIRSTALPTQTEAAGKVAELVYAAYGRMMGQMGLEPLEHGRLQMFLYATRDEFRSANGIEGWAEAIYRKPVCHQYFAANTPNPFHWMVHEATHQLSREVAGLKPPRWLDEGLAGCFGTGRIDAGRLDVEAVDTNTYPAWWVRLIATSGKLEEDRQNGSVIPLRAIVSGEGGPRLDSHVNLYYLHWWTLARHLMLEHPQGLAALLRTRGDVAAFERCIGPLDEVEREWYRSVLALKERLEGASTPPVSLAQR